MPKSNITHRIFTKSETLLPETIFWPSSVSVLTLKIDDFVYEFPWADCNPNDDYTEVGIFLSDIEQQYSKKLKVCNIAALHNNTPFHDETYCYSKQSKKWYLIAQGKGYA